MSLISFTVTRYWAHSGYVLWTFLGTPAFSARRTALAPFVTGTKVIGYAPQERSRIGSPEAA